MTQPECTAHVPAPALDLREEGTPISTAFGDVYFSRAGGVAETEHVFLRGNGLPERWRDTRHFTICELGFGTGLNFLVTVKQFRKTAPAGARLHYIAIEKFPFAPEVLRDLLAHQPELAEEAEQLLANYPLRLPGIHRIHIGNVSLTLLIGDMAEMLPQISWPDFSLRSAPREPRAAGVSASVGDKVPFHQPCVDAWFLDGFSPAKNPDMWSEGLFDAMKRLSVKGTTVATFTAASAVRRGLAEAGFAVTKVAGFGHKREMSVGVYGAGDGANQRVAPSTVMVIGAGIAGATTARALAERGFAVTVLERGSVAAGASGNAAGVLFPQISKRWNDASAWYFTAYGYGLLALRNWQRAGLSFDHAQCGMLRLPRHAEDEAQLSNIATTHGLDAAIVQWLEQDAASAKAGVALATGGAYFPEGMWVNPSQLCAALLQHENITLREQAGAASWMRHGNQWQVTLETGELLVVDALCIAAANESAAWLGAYGISLNAVGGQVSMFAASGATSPLATILCHSGYIIPAGEQVLVGATYHREDMLAVTSARHAENRAALEAVLPHWLEGDAVAGRSSIRATTPDRLPYIGCVAEGLYVSTGHGSRGLLSAPLGAEIIASHMAGETPPVAQALLKKVNPLRFARRT